MSESLEVSINLPILEKLQYKEEKNILIQGLPSAIEKAFCKLSFSKNVTPLLRTRKIDYALVFAVNLKQLNDILKEVITSLAPHAKLWVAYPKLTSKIATDLNRDNSWDYLIENDFRGVRLVALDHVWSALRFKKVDDIVAYNAELEKELEDIEMGIISEANNTIELPKELAAQFEKNILASNAFDTLTFSHKQEYIIWINTAKKVETRERRVSKTIEMLEAGKIQIEALEE